MTQAQDPKSKCGWGNVLEQILKSQVCRWGIRDLIRPTIVFQGLSIRYSSTTRKRPMESWLTSCGELKWWQRIREGRYIGLEVSRWRILLGVSGRGRNKIERLKELRGSRARQQQEYHFFQALCSRRTSHLFQPRRSTSPWLISSQRSLSLSDNPGGSVTTTPGSFSTTALSGASNSSNPDYAPYLFP